LTVENHQLWDLRRIGMCVVFVCVSNGRMLPEVIVSEERAFESWPWLLYRGQRSEKEANSPFILRGPNGDLLHPVTQVSKDFATETRSSIFPSFLPHSSIDTDTVCSS
jgi:hypothetical protein